MSRTRALVKILLSILLAQILCVRDIPWTTVHAFARKSSSFRSRNVHCWSTNVGLEEATTPSDVESKPRKKNAELIISIGPPCSNKEEALEAFLASAGYQVGEPDSYRSVSLRETSSGVYHLLPVAAFLYPATHLADADGSISLHPGATLRDRLQDPHYAMTDSEIRNVILRLSGRVTPGDFAVAMEEQALKAGDTKKYFRKRRLSIVGDLTVAMEEVAVDAIGEVLARMQSALDKEFQSEEELPYDDQKKEDRSPKLVAETSAEVMSARALIKTPHVSLFVPERIFYGGLDKARESLSVLLEKEPSDVPLAWKSTNSRPSEYADILAVAEKANRPVKFIAWGSQWMPEVSRKDLLKRNIRRFRETGRYIPAGAIGGALDRITNLTRSAEEVAKFLAKDGEDWEDHVDAAYARLAGYKMRSDGTVIKVGECRDLAPPFRRKQRSRKPHKRRKQK